ncbi:unnamed protein product [Parajaminaea phylloscopi]
MRVVLVCGYLVYTFATSLSQREVNAYTLLGVGQDADVDVIRKAFRRLAMVYHPDKVGPRGEGFFIALRRSHDVLSDPVKRFAYDRFGIAVLDWKDALSYREHMVIGVRDSVVFYVANYLVLGVIAWFHKDSSPLSFWHITLLLALVSAEMKLLISPSRPWLLQTLLPHYTQRDVVVLFHQMYTSCTMAARQVLPYLSSSVSGGPTPTAATPEDAQRIVSSLTREVEKLQTSITALRLSTERTLASDIRPLQGEPTSGCDTRSEAARDIANASTAKAKGRSEGDGNGEVPSGNEKLTSLEDAYVHLVSRSLISESLLTRPEFREVLSKSSASKLAS